MVGGGGATAKYGRFLLIKAERSVEEERRTFCLPAKKKARKKRKKLKRLLGSAVQQRVPESEWVDEGLNGLEGKLGMCLPTGATACASVCVCARVQVCWSLCVLLTSYESVFRTTQVMLSVTPPVFFFFFSSSIIQTSRNSRSKWLICTLHLHMCVLLLLLAATKCTNCVRVYLGASLQTCI